MATAQAIPAIPPYSLPARSLQKEINLDDITALSTPDLIKLLQDWNALPKSVSCQKCGSEMNLTPDESTLDGFKWTCRTRNEEEEAKAKRQKKKLKTSGQYRCNYG